MPGSSLAWPRWLAGCLAVGCLLLSATSGAGAAEPHVALGYDPQVRPLQFAASEIRRALAARGLSAVEGDLAATARATNRTRFLLVADPIAADRLATRLGVAPPTSRASESYALRRLRGSGAVGYLVLGADPTGAMYGGLDLAEAIRIETLATLADSDHAPHVEERGIKFNIPLDLRTPSYSDCSDAAQQNIPEMWSLDFWRSFLDELARHRYNVLTLWSLHPFPSIVRVPEYPAVALDDVWRTTLKLDDTFSHSGSDMVRPAMLDQVEIVRRLTIDQKIQFWRDVMQHAHDRGIDVYWFTWNIFTFGAEGKYGITRAQTNRATIDYFRASVRETILTYPLLAGLGVTAGEQMENRRDEFSKEKWLWHTYGEGVRDALKLAPGRQVRLIHRFHQTGLGEILDEWKGYPGPFDLSFKYAIAHMYSVPNPPYIKSALPHLHPGLRTWLTVRNDDIYSFRWGDPQFARAFIRHLPGPDKVAGFYMGPDGYCWGREFLSTEPETPRQLVLEKQWFSFMLWGRLSYDPDLTDSLFERTLAARFPQVPAATLLEAWSHASRIFPQITRLFWGDIDLRWLPEACLSHPRHRGFYTVRHFIEGQTMPESGILNITAWRGRQLRQQPAEGITPLEVAAALDQDATSSLRLVSELRATAGQGEPGASAKELRLTLGDLEAFAHIGHYYAAKIRAACELALFDATRQTDQQASAIRHLTAALGHWQRYAATAAKQYRPALYNRVGYVDLDALTTKVEADLEIARQWQPGTIPDTIRARQGDTPFKP